VRGDGDDHESVSLEVIERVPVAEIRVSTRGHTVEDLAADETRERRRIDARSCEGVRAKDLKGKSVHHRTLTDGAHRHCR
jgi:hypothetical protein